MSHILPLPSLMGPGRLPADTRWVLLPDGPQVPLASVELLFNLERRGARLIDYGAVLTCRLETLSQREVVALSAHRRPLGRILTMFINAAVH